ncbi:uncharacterized protein LOC124409197 [Diprion similis]|uniref:uncharacterized protein LOC124409197 n=1 Tax=Diprion similis TaxID=362088 RepID=UPI001EF93992|nr:uncharacterized protein LOC124409197 [Diprion similis]
MRKFRLASWLLVLQTLIVIVCYPVEGQFDHLYSPSTLITDVFTVGVPKRETPMHKVLFTQRGYIQFLRWELPVPEIEEFTFCLWIKSFNLTYAHSIFSYSKDETDRLVRSWISPFGRSLHLEIGGLEIMAHPIRLEEHRWYHVCQSWDNQIGRYAAWIDGQKATEGQAVQLAGHVIPGGGDIVVGQEYTDFDKGLEEGIEGAVVGFNLLLVSAFERSKNFYNQRDSILSSLGYGTEAGSLNSNFAFKRSPEVGHFRRRTDETSQRLTAKPVANRFIDYPMKIVNARREGAFESTLREYLGDDGGLPGTLMKTSDRQRPVLAVKFVHKSKREARQTMRDRTKRRGGKEPLGLQLMHLTYSHCEIGRGSPFIGGSKMLISWTRTPVKVFGGAILKDAKSSCGNF